jgi:hypothetical protein
LSCVRLAAHVLERRRTTGETSARPQGGGMRPKLAGLYDGLQCDPHSAQPANLLLILYDSEQPHAVLVGWRPLLPQSNLPHRRRLPSPRLTPRGGKPGSTMNAGSRLYPLWATIGTVLPSGRATEPQATALLHIFGLSGMADRLC